MTTSNSATGTGLPRFDSSARSRTEVIRPGPATADPDGPAFLDLLADLARADWLDAVLARQRHVWAGGPGVWLEAYLGGRPDLAGEPDLVLELIQNEVLLRGDRRPAPSLDEYRDRFPWLEGQLRDLFAVRGAVDWGSLLAVPPRDPCPRPPAPAPPPNPEMMLLPEVAGYELIAELGRGGMGVVYKARDTRLNRAVALKMLLGGAFADCEELARFRREAEAIAKLQHPNIVQVYEVGTHTSPLGDRFACPYIALEFVGGGSLAARLDGRPQPPREAAGLLEVLARAVHCAHRQGIIHRDLKPANILLQSDRGERTEDGQKEAVLPVHCPLSSVTLVPKITDFGLAKDLADATGEAKTASGAALGTPEYMAPEQASGRGTIGPAADVYGLGVILYECLTGRPPFEALTPWQVLDAVLSSDPPPISRFQKRVPRDLETIALKCLRKEPAQRYATAEELADDLRRFLDGRPVQARRVGELERAWKWAKRRPVVAGLLAAVAASLLGGTAVSTYFAVEAGNRAGEADDARQAAEQHAEEARQSGEKAVAAEQRAITAREAAESGERRTKAHAAELLFNSALAEGDAGSTDRALDTLVRVLRLAPPGPEAADFRRLVRRNLAAWANAAPVLREHFAAEAAQFVGRSGESFVTWTGPTLRRWTTATAAPEGPPEGVTFPDKLLAVSDDGTKVVGLGRADGFHLLQVYDARTAAPIGQPSRLPLTGSEVTNWHLTATLAAGDRYLAVRFDTNRKQGAPNTLHVFDTATGRPACEAMPVQPAHDRYAVTEARDGRPLLIVFRSPGGRPDRADFFDLRDGKPLDALPELSGTDLALTPDGHTLLSVAQDGMVCWWAPETGRPLREPWRPRKCYAAEAVTADGTTLIAVCSDLRLRFYDLATGLPGCAVIPLGPRFDRTKVSATPDGSAVLLTAPDGAGAQLWHLGTPLPQAQGEAPVLLSHPTALAAAKLDFHYATFSPDRKRALFAGLLDGTDALGTRYGRLADVAGDRPLGRPLLGGTSGCEDGWGWHGHTGGHVFSPDGRLVATCTHSSLDADPYARVWDAATGRPVTPPLHCAKLIHALTFSPDGKTLAVGTVGPVLLWDIATATARSLPQVGPTAGLRFTPDGRYLAAVTRAGWRGTTAGLQFWDLTTGRAVCDLMPVAEAPQAMDFLPDGRTLQMVVPNSRVLGRWDAPTGRPVGVPVYPEFSALARQSVFTPDGARMINGTRGGGLQQWDTATGRPVGWAMIHPSLISTLAVSPDSATLAAAYGDGTVRLWDLATARPIGPGLPHHSPVLAAAFTPDGRSLTTATSDGHTHTWPVPDAAPDDLDLLAAWVRAATGVTVLAGEVALLPPGDWRPERDRVRREWPAGERPPGPSGGAVAWCEAHARAAEQTGNAEAARWHRDRLAELEPQSWLRFAQRAALHTTAGRWDLAAADADRAAALAAGDDLTDWLRHRATIANRTGRFSEENWYLDRLIAARPDEWRLYADRADARGQLGNAPGRAADQARAVERGADETYLVRLADEHAAAGRWSEAADLCARATRPGPLPAGIAYRQALIRLRLGEAERYQSLCTSLMRDLAAGPVSPELVNHIAWCCALAPDAVADYDRPVAAMEQALKLIPPKGRHTRHIFLNTLGAVHYRAGRDEEAVKRLAESVEGGAGEFADWVFLALAHRRLGHTAEAEQWLAKVRDHRPAKDRPFWNGVEEELLRSEALGR